MCISRLKNNRPKNKIRIFQHQKQKRKGNLVGVYSTQYGKVEYSITELLAAIYCNAVSITGHRAIAIDQLTC